MKIVNFSCPPDMAPHLESVFAGEYSIAVEFDSPPVFLDIGANLGAATRWARLRWENAFCIAYEPNPKCHRLLEKNLARLVGSYEIHKSAVMGSHDIETGAPRPTTIRLYQGRHNLGEASVFLETGALENDFVDVPVTFAKDLPQCDVLKADCEGPEREIVTEYLETHDPPACIAVEFHSAGESKRLQRVLGTHYGYRLVKAAEYELNRGVLVWRHEPGIG